MEKNYKYQHILSHYKNNKYNNLFKFTNKLFNLRHNNKQRRMKKQ